MAGLAWTLNAPLPDFRLGLPVLQINTLTADFSLMWECSIFSYFVDILKNNIVSHIADFNISRKSERNDLG